MAQNIDVSSLITWQKDRNYMYISLIMADEPPTFDCRGIHLAHLNIRSLWHKHTL